MGMPLWKVSGSLRHLILTPVSSVTFTPSSDTALAMPLLCFILVSLLPSDSCPGLHDRHHFQVHLGTNHHALGSVCYGGAGISGLAVLCMGEVVVLKSVTYGLCLWPLPLLPLSMYQTKAVIIAMIITAVVTISVTIFCFQTKVRVWGAPPWPLHPPFLYRAGP